MDFWNSLPAMLRMALIGAAFFVAGAALSFGYSYRPLHGAMTWKVAQLEEKLDERNRENLALGDELAKLRAVEATRVDPETLAHVEAELEKTKRALASAEKKLERGEKKRKESIASGNRWRKRYETLRDSQTAAVPAAPTATGNETAATTAPSAAPSGDRAATTEASSPGADAGSPSSATEPSRTAQGSPPGSGPGMLPRNEPQTFP